MKQFGTVLTFKPGIEQGVLSRRRSTRSSRSWRTTGSNYPSRDPGSEYVLHEFDGAHGGPVWYIP
jgi:hypothetical protein